MALISIRKNEVLSAWRDNRIRLKATQGEGGIKLAQFKLVDDNGAIDLTTATEVLLNGIKSNGTGCSIACDIVDTSNGIVSITEQTGITDIAGDVKCTLEVIAPNGNIKFDGITLDVASNPTEELIKASDAFTSLTKALNKVALITPEGTVEIDDFLTDDGTNAVQGNVIKKYIDESIQLMDYVDITNSIDMDNGHYYQYINGKTADEIYAANSSTKTTGLLECNFGDKFKISGECKYFVYLAVLFDENKRAISYVGEAEEPSSGVGTPFLNKEIVIPKNCKYIAFSTHTTPLIVKKYQAIENIKEEVVSARGGYNSLRERLDDTIKSEQFVSGLEEKANKDDVNIYGFYDITSKKQDGVYYYNSKTPLVYDNASSILLTDCKEGEKFKVSGYSIYQVALMVYFYDDNTIEHINLVSSGQNFTDVLVTVPSGCSMIAFQSHTNGDLKVERYGIIRDIKDEIDNINESVKILSVNNTISYYEPLDFYKFVELGSRHQIVNGELQKVPLDSDSDEKKALYNYWQTAILKCNPGDKFKVTGHIESGFPATAIAIFVDSNKQNPTYIGRGSSDGNQVVLVNQEIVAPDNAKYVAFTSYQEHSKKGKELFIQKCVTQNVKDEAAKIAMGEYRNPLYNKTLFVDGDSVAQGNAAYGTSYADIIANNNNMVLTKTAEGGTTIAVCESNKENLSIYERVLKIKAETDKQKYDYILLEGGFNDMFQNVPLGELMVGYNSEPDVSTTIGATEGICKHLITYYFDTPKLFVLGHKQTNWLTVQDKYWNGIKSALEKWGIPYVDLRHESNLMLVDGLTEKYFCNGDGTHPTRKTYDLFYVPVIEKALICGTSGKIKDDNIAFTINTPLSVDTSYYLKEQTELSLIFPANASPGHAIYINFISGETETTLISSGCIGLKSFVPNPKSVCEIHAQYNGSYWVCLTSQTEVGV